MSELQIFSATALTVVLAVASWGKFRDPARFWRALGTYGVIPKGVVPALVVGVPAAEAGLGVLQWVEPVRSFASTAIAIMFVAFTLLLLRSLLKGEEAD